MGARGSGMPAYEKPTITVAKYARGIPTDILLALRERSVINTMRRKGGFPRVVCEMPRNE